MTRYRANQIIRGKPRSNQTEQAQTMPHSLNKDSLTGALFNEEPWLGVLKRINLSAKEATIRPAKANPNNQLRLRKRGIAVNSEINLIKGGTEIFKQRIKPQNITSGPLSEPSPALRSNERLLENL